MHVAAAVADVTRMDHECPRVEARTSCLFSQEDIDEAAVSPYLATVVSGADVSLMFNWLASAQLIAFSSACLHILMHSR